VPRYSFQNISDKQIKFVWNGQQELMSYCRFGGNNYPYDLEYFDPPGGPFIRKGMAIENREITRIDLFGEDIILTLA
jgi:hypothetical protein